LPDTLGYALDAARVKSASLGASRRASACADAPGRRMAGTQRAAPCIGVRQPILEAVPSVNNFTEK